MLFISPEKFFLFSRYLSFCLDVLVMFRNGLNKKIKLVSYFMTSQLGQLTERSIRNILFEKSYRTFAEKTSP